MTTIQVDKDQELVLEDGKWLHYRNGVVIKGTPKSIFKYYSLNENNLDALENNYFYLSNPKDFNDPFDCNFNLITEKQRDFISGFPSPILNDVINKGITSFSSHGMHPLMWGHYTSSFRGFVLEFNPEFDIIRNLKIRNKYFLKVIYTQNPNSISQSLTFSELYQLIIKLDHWSYENEWRLIVDKNENSLDKIYYLPNAIKSISFGYQMHEFGRGEKHDYLKNKLISILRNNFPSIPQFIVGPDAKKLELKKLPLYEVKI